MELNMRSFFRISSLGWAQILVYYALFMMQNYLTQVWGLSFTHAAGILNSWNGFALVLPLFVLFFRDWSLADHKILAVSSIASVVGIGFVTLSVPSDLANPCNLLERALFYTGMALIAVGMAAIQISLRSFLYHQDGNSLPWQARAIPLVIVEIVGAIGLPYIKPWKLQFGIPAIFSAFAAILFFSGFFPPYKYKMDVVARRSPVMRIYRVFVACFRNICQDSPRDDGQYHRNEGDAVQSFKPTRCLRCLERAAIKKQGTSKEQVSVAEVEDAKIAVRMVPMWLTFIICGIVSSTGNTYFAEQADKLDRHMGKWNVPLTALPLFQTAAKSTFNFPAKYLLKKCEKWGVPIGLATAMVFSILCCINAAKIEERRLNALRKDNLFDNPDVDIPMSIYWMLFQSLMPSLKGVLFNSTKRRLLFVSVKIVWR